MGRVTELKFQKRYNVAQYEHEEYSITVVCEDGENPVEALAKMKGAVSAAKEAEEIPWSESEGAAPVDKKEEEKPAKPRGGKKPAAKKPKEEEPEEEAEEPEEPEEEAEEPEEEAEEPEEEAEEPEEPEEPEEKKPQGGKKNFRKKGAVYSRASDLHKKLFAEALSKVMGKDFLAKSPATAKKASLKLSGAEFLDSDGKVLQSFKDEMKKLCK